MPLPSPEEKHSVQLRSVQPEDLPVFFEHQLDPESSQMAMVYPRKKLDFDQHWQRIVAEPTVTVRSILFDGILAGNICCFSCEDENFIGYWIEKDHWNKGIASEAVRQMLVEFTHRPLLARVAETNVASIRVLEKAGFLVDEYLDGEETEFYRACREVVMRKD